MLFNDFVELASALLSLVGLMFDGPFPWLIRFVGSVIILIGSIGSVHLITRFNDFRVF